VVGWFMPRTLRSWLELSLVLVDLEDIYYIGIRARFRFSYRERWPAVLPQTLIWIVVLKKL
jgi:hypothetical protein